MTFPWDQLPAVPEPSALSTEDTIAAMQRDLAFIVTHTAIKVHSNHDELAITVNTPRGQIIPRGTCTFTDGSTVELQDVGMPQPGMAYMTVQELVAELWRKSAELGLKPLTQ